MNQQQAAQLWDLSKGKCINARCKSKGKRKLARSRGLCQNCYMALRNLIASGTSKTVRSWEDAEKLGLCLAPFQMCEDKRRFAS